MVSIAEMEANARKWNDYYKIPVTNNNERGEGDARDAFRHAYTTLEWKRYLMEEWGFSNQLASKIAYGALGAGVELLKGDNFRPDSPSAEYSYSADLYMDLWNDAKGSQLTSSSEAESARKVKEMLDKGDLITQNKTVDTTKDLADLKVPGTGDNYADNWGNIMLEIYRNNYDMWKALGNLMAEATIAIINFIKDIVGDISEAIESAIENIWNKPSPIALDINKSGKIETTAVANSKTYFDVENKINKNATNDNLIIDNSLTFCRIAA